MKKISTLKALLGITALGALCFFFLSFQSSKNTEDLAQSVDNTGHHLKSDSAKQSRQLGRQQDLIAKAKKFASEDPLAGIAFAETLETAAKLQFLEAFFAAWSSHAPAECISFLTKSWELGLDNNGELPYHLYIRSSLDNWILEDSAGAATHMLETLNQYDLNLAAKITGHLQYTIAQWAKTSYKDAFEWLIHQDSEQFFNQTPYLNAIIAEWSKHDPLEALAQSNQFPKHSREYFAILNQGLSTWSNKDATAAAEWFSQNLADEDSLILGQAAESIGIALFKQRTGPEALTWVDSLKDPGIRHDAISSLNFVWANGTDDTSLLDSLREKVEENPEIYQRYLEDNAIHIATTNPALITTWLNDRSDLNANDDSVIVSTVTALSEAHEDFTVAMSWSQWIQNEDRRLEAQALLLDTWEERNKEELREWISNNADSLPEPLSLKYQNL